MTKRRRVWAYRSGLLAETSAALVLASRVTASSPGATRRGWEIVARKGKRLAFVEVKWRRSFEEAAWTLPAKQWRRIVRAAQYWLSGHPGFAGHELAFDVVLAAPFAWPRYIQNAFPV